jgi:transketolase
VTTDAFTIEPPPEAPEKDYAVGDMPAFSETMKKYDMESVVHSGKMATRRAYGVALRALGHVNKDVVALDADVSNSTFADMFRKDPALAPRFIECKIAEQNMFSVGVGLSAGGKTPLCSTFAKFVTRGYDQIEMGMNSGASLKIIGSHAGVSLAADGPSQMSLPDIAWFRALSTTRDHRGNPGCYILQPADAFAAYALTAAMAEHDGMCYMRTLRPDTEFLYNDDTVFNLGGFEALNEGRDVLIVASGYMVHECNKALNGLDKAGVTATLVDAYSIPFDTDALLDLANKCNGYVLTVEDNYGGGLGSAVADALAESGDAFTLKQMYVRKIPKSAKEPEEILDMLGLSHKHIVENALSLLGVGAA